MINGRPVIAVVATRVYEREQRIMIDGIMKQAEEYGFYVIVISNIYNFNTFGDYFNNIEIENKIYELAESEKIDGVIFMAESVIGYDIKDFIYEKIAKNNIPVIVTGTEMDGNICINNDVRVDFRDIARHLTEVHGFTDIHILTGHKKLDTSNERVEGVRDVLKEKNIPFPDENIIYGNYWTNSGEDTAMEYISGKRRLPQAIICANDYMAYGLIDTFFKHGINIPEDVTVIGYEYAGERYYHSPILTTYLRNRSSVGAQAVCEIRRMLTGEKSDKIPLNGCMVCGDTCSCGVDKKFLGEELENVRWVQFHNSMTICGNFEQQLAVCRSISDYIRALQDYSYLIRNIKGLYLCLYENWCNIRTMSRLDVNSNNEMMVMYRIISPIEVSSEPHFYERHQLFAGNLDGAGEKRFLYFVPMFTDGIELGYFIFQYTEPDGYDSVVTDWINSAVNALNILRMRNDIHELLECNNLSVFHDTATGLYNKTGFYREFDSALERAGENNIISAVMIKTRLFTDETRIDEKGISVKIDSEIAECMKRLAVGSRAICAKLPDNFFIFAAVGNFPDDYAGIIADRLDVLITHSPVYSSKKIADTVAFASISLKAENMSTDRVLDILSDEISRRTADMFNRRRTVGFNEFNAVRSSIYKSPEKHWDAENECRDFNLSCGHFRAAYKNMFGVSFHKDLIQSRISLAKFLLMTTALSLPAIAAKCGYEDDKYFMRQFRQHTGTSPNVYRKFESSSFGI
ncbi:MAG: substrate-binding domain-containing protein [Ruminococcus sp.]|nr:substrate-binding domain-containing protein [Ruminococcus sp.]